MADVAMCSGSTVDKNKVLPATYADGKAVEWASLGMAFW